MSGTAKRGNDSVFYQSPGKARSRLGSGSGDSTKFMNKFWAICGIGYSDAYDSIDGITWNQRIADCGLGARAGAASCIHNGELFIAGGYVAGSPATYYNDVWKSTDGTSFSQVTASAAWSSRYRSDMVSYDGYLWLFAGQPATGLALADVWKSTDGVTWTLVTAAAPWGKRYGHSTIVYDDHVLLIGGIDESSSFWVKSTEVWKMDSSAVWTKIAFGITRHWSISASDWYPTAASWDAQVAVKNGVLYLVGGVASWSSGTATGVDIAAISYRSTDGGYTWQELVADSAKLSVVDPLDAPCTQINRGTLAVSGRHLYLIGGSVALTTTAAPRVCKSQDGSTWVSITDTAAFGARAYHVF